MNVKQNLIELYESKFKGNKELLEFTIENELYGPLLMTSIENGYDKAKFKILIVGQEAGWSDAKIVLDNVSDLIRSYEDFKMANNFPQHNSPFWRATKLIINMLSPDSEVKDGLVNYLWTNVSKYSDDGDPIPFESQIEIIRLCNLLPDEVEILMPDLIIFFSGPNYDSMLQEQFGKELTFERVFEHIPEKEIAHLKHPLLFPKIHAIRTYHPNSLQRMNKWFYLDLIANDVTKQYMIEFRKQLIQIAKDLNLHISFSSIGLGEKDSEFYFFDDKWKYTAIGFSFERSWAKDLFYGIRVKHLDREMPSNLRVSIQESFGQSDEEATANWPFWKWYDKDKWNEGICSAISIPDLIKDIKSKVENLKSILMEMESTLK